MGARIRGVASVAALVLAGAVVSPLAFEWPQVQLGDRRPAPTAQVDRPAARIGAISGVVIDATTGAPIAGAQVTLSATDIRFSTTGLLTDAKGRFVFANLAPSKAYRLSANRIGYVDNAEINDARARVITLDEGEWIDDARVTLMRAASISGVVIDERGEPVVGTRVRAISLIAIAGRELLAAGPATVTDDRGAYRLGDLGPGRYLVVVPSTQATVPAATTAARIAGQVEGAVTNGVPRPVPVEQTLDLDARARLVLGTLVPPPPRDGRLMGYAMTFHSGSPRVDQTTPIDLAAGDQKTGVDIRLTPVPTASVSGQLINPPNMKFTALIRLVALGLEDLAFGSEVGTTLPDANGDFVFLNVPAGAYVIDVSPSASEYATTMRSLGEFPRIPGSTGSSISMTPAPAGPPGTMFSNYASSNNISGFSARMPITVEGADQSGIRLDLKPTGSISGRIVVESDANAAATPPTQFRLLNVLTAEPAGGQPSLGRAQNGREPEDPADVFYLTALLPGEYVIRLQGQPGSQIKSVIYDGRDYTNMPFDLAAVRDYERVTVTITSKVAKLSGTVRADLGGAADPPTVVVFPVEEAQWSNYGLHPVRIQSQPATPRQTFAFDSLPAGDYFVVAVRANDDALWRNPGFFTRVRAAATAVSLGWGETKAVSLTPIDLRQGGK
jgi:hypothetical protein